MSKVDFREEVVNVVLASLLEQRGMLSVPETIRKSVARKTRDLPDIVVADLLGIRMVIEGRFNSGKAARDSLLKDARERVELGISPVCLAVQGTFEKIHLQGLLCQKLLQAMDFFAV